MRFILTLLNIKYADVLKNFIIFEIFKGTRVYKYWFPKKKIQSFLKVLQLVSSGKRVYIYSEQNNLEIIFQFLEDLSNFCFIEALIKNQFIYFLHFHYKNKIFYFYNTNLITPFIHKKFISYFFFFEKQSILTKFYLQADKYKLRLTKYSTATTLFLKFFLCQTNYFKKLKLKDARFISKSYLGGRVFLKTGLKFQTYAYDINFQYGWTMRKKYPVYVDKIIYSSFDISISLGFFKVKLIFLPKFYETFFINYKRGDILILYSNEIQILIDIGFKFKILKGISFKKRRVFEKYYNSILKN